MNNVICESALFYDEVFFIGGSSDSGKIGDDISCGQPLACVVVLLKGVLDAVSMGSEIFFFYGLYSIRADEYVAVHGAYDAAALGVTGLGLGAHE